jgi:eukaryotic-like serine/threonine-protein kinase
VCEVGRVYCGIYRVKSLLGRGGTAEVYWVHHEITKRDAALKVLRRSFREHEDFVERFHGEGRALSELRHANVVEVFHVGVDAEIGPYIAMELLEGKTLAQILSRTRMSASMAINVLSQIARGLEALHDAGMIHRDVKPGNIFVSASGVAKILDLGAAKIPKYAFRPTDVMRVPGTLKYQSPEAFAGEEVTARSDAFALGVVAYEVLAGCHPALVDRAPDQSEEASALGWRMNPVVKPLARVVPGLPEAVSDVIGQALARDPAARFASMGAFANALRLAANERAVAQTQALTDVASGAADDVRTSARNADADRCVVNVGDGRGRGDWRGER